jgi:hypothetical protein
LFYRVDDPKHKMLWPVLIHLGGVLACRERMSRRRRGCQCCYHVGNHPGSTGFKPGLNMPEPGCWVTSERPRATTGGRSLESRGPWKGDVLSPKNPREEDNIV